MGAFLWLQVFEVIKKQEETRQAEMETKVAEFKAMQAQAETVRHCFLYPFLITIL